MKLLLTNLILLSGSLLGTSVVFAYCNPSDPACAATSTPTVNRMMNSAGTPNQPVTPPARVQTGQMYSPPQQGIVGGYNPSPAQIPCSAKAEAKGAAC